MKYISFTATLTLSTIVFQSLPMHCRIAEIFIDKFHFELNWKIKVLGLLRLFNLHDGIFKPLLTLLKIQILS